MMFLAVEWAPLLSSLGVPAFVATTVTGIFAWVTKRSDHKRPDVLSSGYSSLVGDLQKEVTNLRQTVSRLEERIENQAEQLRELKTEGDAQQGQVNVLQRQVSWLWDRLPKEHQDEFRARWPETIPWGNA